MLPVFFKMTQVLYQSVRIDVVLMRAVNIRAEFIVARLKLFTKFTRWWRRCNMHN